MTGTAQPPPLIATIGLHASASTWVFNIVRELMIGAVGEARVLAVYADAMDRVPDEAARAGRHLVVKSHHGSAELDAWLAAERATIVLSVRDPRDACISMAQRFKSPLDHVVRWIANDCNRLARLAGQGHKLLRYEDRFFEDPAAVEGVSQFLGLAGAPAAFAVLSARYRPEAVRAFAERLADLPAERLTMIGSSHLMDEVTQIHAPHIGDARSGKWRDLPGPLQVDLTRIFAPFLDRFGYQR